MIEPVEKKFVELLLSQEEAIDIAKYFAEPILEEMLLKKEVTCVPECLELSRIKYAQKHLLDPFDLEFFIQPNGNSIIFGVQERTADESGRKNRY